MQLTIVAGARPNFMKIAPIIHSIHKATKTGKNISYRLIHTGQHYDKNMSSSFFDDLNIPAPDANLECGGGSQAEQTASIMVKFEKELQQHPSDLVLVVGDVTSTMACSIVAKKLCIKVAHVEAGIRSGDLTMPEEINRMVTDSITDYFFTTSVTANRNLENAGISQDRIFLVGNTMIDTLLQNQRNFRQPAIYSKLNLQSGSYIVLTLHRPNNVDGEQKLMNTITEIIGNVQQLPIVFPVHPRTIKTLQTFSIATPNLHYTEPLSYLEFNYLVKNCKCVITDSGGITEETTVLGVPCITLRDNTERPETVSIGTNELIGTDPRNIKPALDKLFQGQWKQGGIPEKWDGKSSDRIIEALVRLFN
jgi:UDP-N-acetylglucosamine 2-epimerase (non-hydrolysing)